MLCVQREKTKEQIAPISPGFIYPCTWWRLSTKALQKKEEPKNIIVVTESYHTFDPSIFLSWLGTSSARFGGQVVKHKSRHVHQKLIVSHRTSCSHACSALASPSLWKGQLSGHFSTSGSCCFQDLPATAGGKMMAQGAHRKAVSTVYQPIALPPPRESLWNGPFLVHFSLAFCHSALLISTFLLSHDLNRLLSLLPPPMSQIPKLVEFHRVRHFAIIFCLSVWGQHLAVLRTLFSGLTPSKAQETVFSVEEWNWISNMQSKCPTCYAISFVPTVK